MMIEDLIEEGNEKGLLFTAYQLADEKRPWQAGFCAPGDPRPVYGYGESLEQAAWRALESAKEALATREQERRRPIAPAATPEDTGGLFD